MMLSGISNLPLEVCFNAAFTLTWPLGDIPYGLSAGAEMTGEHESLLPEEKNRLVGED
jgi:hypothetical protein